MKKENHLLVNIDSRSQPVEILVIRYDKRNKKLELLQDQYVCNELTEIKQIVRSYIKRIESLKSVTLDSGMAEREAFRDLSFRVTP